MTPGSPRPTAGRLDDLASLVVLLGIAAVLSAAMVLQFGFGEVPCPLCLIERVGMFGICFGAMMHFRPGSTARAAGVGLVFAVFLLVVSVRQVLLDIVPRPGHAYVGSAVLGLHMPVWSVVIAASVIAGLAVKLAAFGETAQHGAHRSRAVAGLARAASLYVLLLAAVGLVAVLAQCGFGACRAGG